MSAGETSPAPAKGSFESQVNFDTLFAGLASQGIALTDEERTKLQGIVRNRTREFNGGSLLGGDADGIMLKFINMFVYFLQSVYQNIGGASSGNFTGWLGQQGTDTANFGSFKALQDTAAYIYMDMQSAGGNLARAATLVSGVSADGTTPVNHAWDVYSQIRRAVADPVNPRSVSLNINHDTSPEGAAVTPPPGLPRIQSLTQGRA